MIPRIAAVATVFLAGCSILPPSEYPPHRDFHLEVLYQLPTEGERRLQVPASGAELTIFELSTQPTPLSESFEGGKRWLLPPVDVDSVTLRVRYRAFGEAGDPEHLFPGAALIRPVQ